MTPSAPPPGSDQPGPTPPGSDQPDSRPAHRLHYVARTDRGLVRSTNQDSLFAGDRLLVVADGMGGHAAGDTASRLVVDAFMPLNLGKPGPDLLRPLLEATRGGNAAIADMVAEHPDLEGMGTTVTAMLFDDGRAALAHVGDSRAYLYRDGVLHQLTHDDTFVQSLVDDGRITEHQAHEHPQRNLLLRALTGLELDPMLVEREIRVGDRYMLCSDGLSGVVDPESIADALAHPDPEIAADTLIQLALVNGGPDNVTTIVADVLATGGRSGAGAAPTDAPAPAPGHDDPASTNPIARLTREMPRVPLPPIPEEPAAPAEVLDDDDDTDGRGTSDDIDGAAADRADPVESVDGATSSAATGRLRTGTPEASADTDTDADAGGASGPDERDRPPRRGSGADPGRRHWQRRGAVIVAALVLLGVAITGATMWVRHQYYVSEQGNVVVVFRGVNGSLLGWRFSTFEETSCAGDTDCTPMKVSDLQPAAQNQVRAGIKVTSLAGARTVVQRLSAQLLPPCPPIDDGDDATPANTAPTTSAPQTTAPQTTAQAITTTPGTIPTTSNASNGAPQTTTAPAAATAPITSAAAPTEEAVLAADAPGLALAPPAATGPAIAGDADARTARAADPNTPGPNTDDANTPDPNTDTAIADRAPTTPSLLGETLARTTPADGEASGAATELVGAADGPAVPGAASNADGNAANDADGTAVGNAADGVNGVLPLLSASMSGPTTSSPPTSGSTTPSPAVTATPLAPATPVPGVTCRTMQ